MTTPLKVLLNIANAILANVIHAIVALVQPMHANVIHVNAKIVIAWLNVLAVIIANAKKQKLRRNLTH